MDIRELGRLDLNLLVALEALLEERSVSRAADRLFVTQSAMSKTLSRLRELFNDPLFVRKSGAMIPTPRAVQLGSQLPYVLQAVQAMIQPPEFDPASYQGRFNLLVQGHAGLSVLPRLMEKLEFTAPGISLRATSSAEHPFEELSSGELDFILQAEKQQYPPELKLTTLGFAPPVLLARAGHPLDGEEVTWDKLRQYPLVSLMLKEIAEVQFVRGGSVSFFLRDKEFKPRLETDNLATAIQTVLRSDFLFPAPPLFVEQDELVSGLVALPLPAGEKITLKYVLVMHRRVLESAPHQFLYEQILETTDEFRAEYGLPPLAEMRSQRNLEY
jgi:DNA-binding transcriptional LysR family regulator